MSARRQLTIAIAAVALAARGAMAQNPRIESVRVSRAPRTDPRDSTWELAPEIELPLFPQALVMPYLLVPTVGSVRVRALHDRDWLALRIEWADSSRDDLGDTGRFTDAVAIELPLGIRDSTSPFMGSSGRQVHIVQWRADRQRDVERGRPRRIQDLHPGAWVDVYPPYRRASGADSGAGASSERRYFVAGAAGNPRASFGQLSPVEELWAEGPGTLASQSRQDAEGAGRWEAGRWRVVIAVPRRARDRANARLPEGEALAVAFAVWNGADGQAASRKQYHPWVELLLPRARR